MSISQYDICNPGKKIGKYKLHNPFYYYYNIDGNIYKYTCNNPSILSKDEITSLYTILSTWIKNSPIFKKKGGA